MKKFILLSFAVISSLSANEFQLEQIEIESTKITEVSQNAKESVDLANVLSKSIPSIDMNRRSAIANDVLIRGQKRDNISVVVDGTKTCGACVNRMDPPISHILTSQIDSLEVIEGPFDVENFGTLSGGIKIKTKKPTKDWHGEINMGYGSFNYTKVGATFSGGDDNIKLLISAISESSNQYKDGNGNIMSKQLSNYVKSTSIKNLAYQDKYKNMKAYTKRSIMAKTSINITNNQKLKLSITANRSDDILYPNSKMDALYDDSNIYSAKYTISNLNRFSKSIDIEYFSSDVDHPMGTNYRLSAVQTPIKVIVNHLTTDVDGLKIKNKTNIDNYILSFGLDMSKREWNGFYKKNNLPLLGGLKSIDNSTTKNIAFFTKIKKSLENIKFTFGTRYDSSQITNGGDLKNNNYKSLNINLLANYDLDDSSSFIFGIGEANRVPDARELYFQNSKGNLIGTDNLKQTRLREIDLGYKLSSEMFDFKLKTFYSKFNDYIYIQRGLTTNVFKNIDAFVYGGEFSGSYYLNDDSTIDMGLSYKHGKKDKALSGQKDKDLANMAPLKGTIAFNYEYKNNSLATVEMQFSDKWNKIDSDNGEQKLSGWSVMNLKLKHQVDKSFDFTIGVNNLFNKNYIISNSYVDLTLITAQATDNIMLVNESGRYLYTNLDFKF